jgi:tripartite ATP-independent transporter DctP family solute receptor
LALCIGTAGAAQAETVLKLGYTATNDSHYGAAANVFGEELAKRTNGRYKVQQFPSSALGGEREMIEAVQLGTQDMVITSTGPVGNFIPATRIFDIPFLFRDYAHARKVLDGPIGQEVLKKFPAKGFVGVVWLENGFRHMTNSRHPINVPADVKGLKIRTMENKVHMEAFKTMGALPTPMAMNELFTALQQGTVDGQENPVPVILSNKLYTVQDNVSLTGHVYSPALLLMSSDAWNKLSEADRKGLPRSRPTGGCCQPQAGQRGRGQRHRGDQGGRCEGGREGRHQALPGSREACLYGLRQGVWRRRHQEDSGRPITHL